MALTPISNFEILQIFKDQGSFVYLQHRTTGSEIDWYDTGSDDGYGYGDPIIIYTGSSVTGSWIQAIIQPIRADEVRVEAGFIPDEYRKAIFSGSTTVSEWDRLQYPSGSDSTEWLILPTQQFQTGNVTLLKVCFIRCTVPTTKQF